MQVICINDTNKPKRISPSEWILEGEIYTVTKVVKLALQPGKFGFFLKEKQLSEQSFPYESYDSQRFAPLSDMSLVNELEEVLLEEV